MMHALYVLWYAKSTSRDEATLNSEKIKPIALTIIRLHLPEGIRQAVTVGQEIFVVLNFRGLLKCGKISNFHGINFCGLDIDLYTTCTGTIQNIISWIRCS